MRACELMLAIVWISWVNGVQAASDVVSEVERAVEQYSKGVGHLTQKLPLPGGALSSMHPFLCRACLYHLQA